MAPHRKVPIYNSNSPKEPPARASKSSVKATHPGQLIGNTTTTCPVPTPPVATSATCGYCLLQKHQAVLEERCKQQDKLLLVYEHRTDLLEAQLVQAQNANAQAQTRVLHLLRGIHRRVDWLTQTVQDFESHQTRSTHTEEEQDHQDYFFDQDSDEEGGVTNIQTV